MGECRSNSKHPATQKTATGAELANIGCQQRTEMELPWATIGWVLTVTREKKGLLVIFRIPYLKTSFVPYGLGKCHQGPSRVPPQRPLLHLPGRPSWDWKTGGSSWAQDCQIPKCSTHPSGGAWHVFQTQHLPLVSSLCSVWNCYSSAKYNIDPWGALEHFGSNCDPNNLASTSELLPPSQQPQHKAGTISALPTGLAEAAGHGPQTAPCWPAGIPPIIQSGSWCLSHMSWWRLCWKWGMIHASWLVSCHNKQWTRTTLCLRHSWGAVFARGLCEGGGQPPHAPFEQFPFCCFLSHMVFWNSLEGEKKRDWLSVLT